MSTEFPVWANPNLDSVKTACNLCLNGCGLIVSREDGRISLRGDKEHPLSHGFMCLKGKAALDVAGSPHRLQYPMRRIGERGSGQWERISWEIALSEIAKKMTGIMGRYGAESVATQALKPKDDHMWHAFTCAIGSPTVFRHDVHVCYAPQLIADTLTFGSIMTYPNLMADEAAATRTFVMWGVNLPETNPAKAAIVANARKSGMKVIVIDPRPINAARTADVWLRVRPGTDSALALGMLNVILKERLYDEAFVKEWAYGFDRLMAHVEPYTADRVSEITWVDKEKIIQAARLIAGNKPSYICTFIGLTMGGHVINTIRSVGLLLAVTGNIDNVGSNFIKAPPRTARIAPLPKEVLQKQLSADKFPLLSGPAGIPKCPNPRDVIDTMLTERPYPIKALLTDCNPLTSLEDSRRTLEALMKLELLVVLDMFMTPTAEFADYVLPLTTFLESDSIADYSAMNLLSARSQALRPRGEARPEAEILLDLLKCAGLGDKLPFAGYRDYLDYRLRPSNITFAEFARLGHLASPIVARKFEQGLLREDKQPGFNTPTGKIELYSTTMEKYGYDPLPVYREPDQSPYSTPDLFKEYPFILITGARSLPMYHGLGVSIPALRKHHPRPLVEISPAAAGKLGVQDGDRVRIETHGKDAVVIRAVKIVEQLDDNIACAEGHWYLPEETDQNKRIWEANINVLTSLRNDFDPVVGGSGCRRLLCRITKA